MIRVLLILCIVLSTNNILAQDTLYFRLSNPWNTVKDINGQYLRKAVLTDSGWLTLDYNARNILVARSFYTDTNFNRKLHCHYYYDENKGFLEEIRCYQNGRLDGIRAGFNDKGDTLWKESYRDNLLLDQKDFSPGTWNGVVFQMAEVESAFPGGKQAWYNYLSNNLRYPKAAHKKKIEGTVIVSFIVSREGKVTDVEVLQSVDPLLDAEAIRLIKNSPDWIPGEQNGKKVKSLHKQSITFEL